MSESSKPLNASQQRALDILKNKPKEWHSPGRFCIPWQSFHVLYKRGLADYRPEDREYPVRYRYSLKLQAQEALKK